MSNIYLENSKGERLDLNPNLIWEDEFKWTPVAQSHTQLLSGALLIETSTKKSGRPITLTLKKVGALALEGGATRGDAKQYHNWAIKHANTPFYLQINNERYHVMFNADRGIPVEAEPIQRFSDPSDSDYVELTLRFVELKENKKEKDTHD